MKDITLLRHVDDLRAHIKAQRANGHRIGLVPTMGALHEGHLSLVNEIGQKVDTVIVSIFVNPTQFAAHEDLDTYPRHEAADLEKLSTTRASVVYAPSASDMYPSGFATSMAVAGPALGLETDERPHFFGGVGIVVTKLLLQVLPDVAIFGEKDYQQLLVIRRIVRDLNIPVEIIGGPIIREADGLAMSSRNAYLTRDQRAIAAHLNHILEQLAGSPHPPEEASAHARAALLEAGFSTVDYACIRDADTLDALGPETTSRRALIAARLGDVRLIDNMAAR
ncbi:MAG: pantoate--beta-alanine ligase [PS1 clade bacterium]|nr:pantoate--beta-alanine ligase [PS1 clade bacterium]HCQ82263.1 pantoate--beta-alanine ligase [Rhodobiaceae bacterium]|tara:strand:+ start:688 stop:1527 length:840 start_codon:yes stop_codon:yes gene_type:complete